MLATCVSLPLDDVIVTADVVLETAKAFATVCPFALHIGAEMYGPCPKVTVHVPATRVHVWRKAIPIGPLLSGNHCDRSPVNPPISCVKVIVKPSRGRTIQSNMGGPAGLPCPGLVPLAPNAISAVHPAHASEKIG